MAEASEIASSIVKVKKRAYDPVHVVGVTGITSISIIDRVKTVTSKAVKARVSLKPAYIIAIGHISGMRGIEACAFRYRFPNHTIELVIGIGERGAIALAQCRAIAIGVIAILFIISRVDRAGRRFRREVPARLPVKTVIHHRRFVTARIGHARHLAIGRESVGSVVTHQACSNALLNTDYTAFGVVVLTADPVRTL